MLVLNLERELMEETLKRILQELTDIKSTMATKQDVEELKRMIMDFREEASNSNKK